MSKKPRKFIQGTYVGPYTDSQLFYIEKNALAVAEDRISNQDFYNGYNKFFPHQKRSCGGLLIKVNELLARNLFKDHNKTRVIELVRYLDRQATLQYKKGYYTQVPITLNAVSKKPVHNRTLDLFDSMEPKGYGSGTKSENKSEKTVGKIVDTTLLRSILDSNLDAQKKIEITKVLLG